MKGMTTLELEDKISKDALRKAVQQQKLKHVSCQVRLTNTSRAAKWNKMIWYLDFDEPTMASNSDPCNPC